MEGIRGGDTGRFVKWVQSARSDGWHWSELTSDSAVKAFVDLATVLPLPHDHCLPFRRPIS